MTKRHAVAILALLTTAGCWFGSPRSGPERSRPSKVNRPRPAETQTPTETEIQPTTSHTVIPLIPGLEEREFKLAQPRVRVTKQGLAIGQKAPTGRLAWNAMHMQLSIPHGNDLGDRRGVASLTARVIADSTRTEASRPSLRDAIEQLGGQLEVSVDGAATHFKIAVRISEWKLALAELVSAIRTKPTRPQIRAEQRAALVALSEQTVANPASTTLARVINSIDVSETPIEALQDLSETNVELFRRRAYRPNGSVLCLSGRNVAVSEVEKVLAPWLGEFAEAPPRPTLPMLRVAGIYWATGESVAPELGLLFDIPPMSGPGSAEFITALECLVGTGSGRLARHLRRTIDPELEYRTEYFNNGPARILVLRMPVRTAQVGSIIAAANLAITNLTSNPPTPAEIKRAAARVRLRILRDQDSPSRSIETLARELLANPVAKPTQLQAFASALAAPERLDLTQAIQVLTARLPTPVVTGGKIADELVTRVTPLGELATERLLDVPKANVAQQRMLARVYLDLAVAATGGKQTLAKVNGFHARSLTRTNRGPNASEITAFDAVTQSFSRVRVVLASVIQTLIKDQKNPDGSTKRIGREAIGKEIKQLKPDEIRATIDQVRRHPVFLLAEVARGEATYRLISVRRKNDRSLAILELEDRSRPRLRISVDEESGLVRTVQSIEHQFGIGTVNVSEHYRDYRNVFGVRVPHHKTKVVDDTSVGSVTIWDSFVPQRPPPQLFALQGK